NGCSSKAWKLNLQRMLCDEMGLTVTVCHYPTGCSKWNPVERRLFSQISTNWAGKPLKSLGIMLGYIRGTTTKAGLTVKAHLDEETYPKGQKVSREEMDRLTLNRHDVCPKLSTPARNEKDTMRASTLFALTLAVLLGLGTAVGIKYAGLFEKPAPP